MNIDAPNKGLAGADAPELDLVESTAVKEVFNEAEQNKFLIQYSNLFESILIQVYPNIAWEKNEMEAA